MLKIENVSYAYDGKFQLSNISLKLQTGEILGVVGKSGCGKTTLLKLIFGDLEPNQGELFWHEEKILGPSHQLIAGKESFKYVTQDFELMPYISVLENVIKPLSRQHIEENISRGRKILETLGLENFENTKVKLLSGGQQQRVALAKALAKTPKLLLLDEPFSHIDCFFKNQLRRKLFKFLKEENITCVLATHDKDDVLAFSDRILILKEGETVDLNTPNNIYSKPKNSYVAGLFGDYNLVKIKYIWSDSKNDKDLIIYPDEIDLEISELGDVDILEQYFKGQFYNVVVGWNSQKLFVSSENIFDKSSSYKLVFKKEKIKSRLGIEIG